jgi:hypothetical protein
MILRRLVIDDGASPWAKVTVFIICRATRAGLADEAVSWTSVVTALWTSNQRKGDRTTATGWMP